MEMEFEVKQRHNKVFYAYSSATIQDNLVVVVGLQIASNQTVFVTDQRLARFSSIPRHAYAFHIA